ncbi:hypothetical protein Vafri_17283 [Volvox africanus]|uniref:Conserved oligomeric Golgi complex subunit 2 n=1 Tax=Volvox africanus TaxID=51714 RepID=A0A8J4F9Y1_9CHLO|nr:hypothetical protein Vafri_17283 [Volvox africanus]
MAEEAAIVTATSDSSLLLGRAGCPVWLNPERFLISDFNADACVADLRRYVPLATLQNELSNYLATLKTKLVEVINEDYADYVGLSGRLANVEGSVVRMRKPLLELRDKLHAVQEAVRSELNSLNQGLRKRKEVATQRAQLELILEVSHVAAKVDKLLEELAASDKTTSTATAAPTSGVAAAMDINGSGSGPSDAELLAQCRLLERVAAEVSRLAFLANKGKDLAFVRSLEPRITAHRAALRGRLSTALALALTPAPAADGNSASPSPGPRSTTAALHALHAAADLGEAATAEAVVRSVVVAPLVERQVGEHKMQGHTSVPVGGAGSGSTSGNALSALLSGILVAIRAQLGPLLDASLAPGSALRSIDLLSNAVLDEVQGALAAAMPGVFSPGVPPAFHANYLATLAWLRQLEGMCATRGSVERLRASAAYASLMRRWNTSVYFSLLYQEIAGELEDALSSDKLEPAAGTSGSGAGLFATLAPPQLAPTAALLRCLRRAVSSDVVLPLLTDRFLRLALQLAQRYATWVSAATTARREAAAAAAAGAVAGGGTAPVAGAVTPPTAQGAGSGGAGSPGSGGGAGPSGSAAWAPTLPADELFAVVSDTLVAREALLGPVTAAFLELLPPTSTPSHPAANDTDAALNGDGGAVAESAVDAATTAVRGALAEAAAAVQASGHGLAAVVTEEVVERCAAAVRQLKGITATYRVTSKAPPTRASHYVFGVLMPLRQLLDAEPVKRLNPALRQELVTLPVAESVCARYAALAEELLVSVRKTESSLKRLKKAKGGPGGEEEPAAGLSDSDKITLQLHLDVEELVVQLRQLMMPPDTAPEALLPSLRRLKEVVAPAPRDAAISGAAGGGGGLL